MRIVDLIEKKRDKNSLTKEEIKYFLNEYLDGKYRFKYIAIVNTIC